MSESNNLSVPFPFWFTTPITTPEEEKRKYHANVEYDRFIERWNMLNLDNLSINELENLLKDASDLSSKFNSIVKSLWLPGGVEPKELKEIRKLVSDKIDTINLPIIYTDDEIVNGYHLYSCKTTIFLKSDFEDFCKLWHGDKTPAIFGTMREIEYGNDMTKEEFMEVYNQYACTDWSKMDEDGNPFEGEYWTASEGSDERNNASELTRKKNGECLFDLPYPKLFVLYTAIDLGCSNRMECVRYSNFICHYMNTHMDPKVKREI